MCFETMCKSFVKVFYIAFFVFNTVTGADIEAKINDKSIIFPKISVADQYNSTYDYTRNEFIHCEISPKNSSYLDATLAYYTSNGTRLFITNKLKDGLAVFQSIFTENMTTSYLEYITSAKKVYRVIFKELYKNEDTLLELSQSPVRVNGLVLTPKPDQTECAGCIVYPYYYTEGEELRYGENLTIVNSTNDVVDATYDKKGSPMHIVIELKPNSEFNVLRMRGFQHKNILYQYMDSEIDSEVTIPVWRIHYQFTPNEQLNINCTDDENNDKILKWTSDVTDTAELSKNTKRFLLNENDDGRIIRCNLEQKYNYNIITSTVAILHLAPGNYKKDKSKTNVERKYISPIDNGSPTKTNLHDTKTDNISHTTEHIAVDKGVKPIYNRLPISTKDNTKSLLTTTTVRTGQRKNSERFPSKANTVTTTSTTVVSSSTTTTSIPKFYGKQSENNFNEETDAYNTEAVISKHIREKENSSSIFWIFGGIILVSIPIIAIFVCWFKGWKPSHGQNTYQNLASPLLPQSNQQEYTSEYTRVGENVSILNDAYIALREDGVESNAVSDSLNYANLKNKEDMTDYANEATVVTYANTASSELYATPYCDRLNTKI